MPRKTRSKKILVKLRRLETQQVSDTSKTNLQEDAPVTETKVSYEFKPNEVKPNKVTTTASQVDYSYVYKDLRKTTLFAVAAIAFQAVLKLLFFK